MKPMKAITVWQPWATLLAYGEKLFETRSWETHYRGNIAIHAAARATRHSLRFFPSKKERSILITALRHIGIVPQGISLDQAVECIFAPGGLPTGCIVSTGVLVACHKVVLDDSTKYTFSNWRDNLTDKEKAFGDFTPGRFAWEIAGMTPLDKPIPINGRQGLWAWNGEVAQW